MNVQLFDDRGRAAKIRAAARREILVIGAAPYRRYNDVKPLDIYQADTTAKKKQIGPTALNHEAVRRADWWKVGRGVATKSESRGNEAGPWKVGPVIMIDLDLTSEDSLEQRLNIAIPVRPMRINVAPLQLNKERSARDRQRTTLTAPLVAASMVLRRDRILSMLERWSRKSAPGLFKIARQELTTHVRMRDNPAHLLRCNSDNLRQLKFFP
jgi:hypothetical protein